MTLFEKPSDVRYVDMAIWIDSHAYTNDCDDLKLYEYIYHLINMFAHKHKFFTQAAHYDDFNVYATSYLFQRLKDPKQFQLKEDNTPRRNKITSILNYIKSSIFGLKTNFHKSEFYTANEPVGSGLVEPEGVLRSSIGLYRSSQDMATGEFALCLEDLPRCVRETCKKAACITHDNFANVYLSVLLTTLNQITLTNKTVKELQADDTNLYTQEFFVDKLYRPKEPLDDVILYELEPSMASYVLFLANKSKKTLARDLSNILQTWESVEALTTNTIQTQVYQHVVNDNED